MKRLYEVEVETIVYVLAETERDAELIACDRTDREWLEGWASAPVEPAEIDRNWRDVPPLVDHGEEPDEEETCAQIADREKREREFATRQAVLPGVYP